MRRVERVIPVTAALIGICCASAGAADYSGFSKLSDEQKGKIIGELQSSGKWGAPNQKPICADILRNQASYDANTIAWTTSAIDLVEKQGWSDMTALVQHVYERPRNVWVYERSFQYLRREKGKTIASDIVDAAEMLRQAGEYNNQITDEQLQAAKEKLIHDPDKEAVLVYAIGVAGRNAGKGGTHRGREAAAEVIQTLDRGMVVQRMKQLCADFEGAGKKNLEWVVDYLKIGGDDSAATKPEAAHVAP